MDTPTNLDERCLSRNSCRHYGGSYNQSNHNDGDVMLKDMLISDAADGDRASLEKLKEYYPELGEVFETTILFSTLCYDKDIEIANLTQTLEELRMELRDVAS